MRLGVLDVVTIASERDTCLVLPTLDHAIYKWNIYITAIRETHLNDTVRPTKTAIVMQDTHTHLRLWVPFSPDPTQPMDYWVIRQREHLYYVSPWFTKGELKYVTR